jgi:hypothetical protein
MPASGSILASLVKANVNTRMAAVNGHSPLAQPNPSYYIEFCDAIGMGIITGGPVIEFTTNDTGQSGTPLVEGAGMGTGIVTDPTFFVQDLYTRVRSYIIADFGRTEHQPYPPSPGNSGEYLLALCEGINDSFLSYYPTAWTLVSTHPKIYQGMGMITDGQFSGLVATAIQASIVAGAPNFIGRFWPRLAQAISESYVALIESNSTGMVTITGTCVPSLTQVCDISGSTGNGMGTAT